MLSSVVNMLESYGKLLSFSLIFLRLKNMFNGDYLLSLSTILNQQDFELLLCILWGIWTDRNKVVHGGSPRQPAAIVTYAIRFHEDFSRARQVPSPATVDSNQPPATLTPPTVQQAPKWQPPPNNCFKLNVDAATNVDQKKLGIGAIIRDHNGSVVAAYSKVVQGSFRSDEMEAKALFHALNWASQNRFAVTHIETDALRVSNALSFVSQDLSCFSDLIMDVRCLLSFFPQVLVTHVKRSANQAAHGLAKFSLGLDDDFCWIGEVPYPIFSVVVNDF
uniref:RNase H type-1 domain-containing protein n=1 Tax=Cannabis sativa TaxID=3483 RepID=A0A803Q3I7_CANSA